MKALLTSGGFTTPEIIGASVDLCNKKIDDISVAIISEAYAVEEGDKHWLIDDLRRLANAFPGHIDMVDLLALDAPKIKARILGADIIAILGGNTDYLMHVFRRTKFDELLLELLETKVYVGSSAGSMVLGNRISTKAYQSIYGPSDDFGIKKYMGLVDFAIVPHLDSKNHNQVLAATKSFEGTVYALKDSQAMVVDGDEVRFVGGEPLKIQNDSVA